MVIGDGGEILTAFHVVKGAQRLKVRALDRQAFEAEIIAADPRSDLAVIVPREIPGVPPPKLKPLPLGDASPAPQGVVPARAGQPVQRGGATAGPRPAGASSPTSPAGSNRRPRSGARKASSSATIPTLLQLDAKLNLGMSGGAVINLKGELVGLTTSRASAAGFDAMAGYAIPMDVQGRRIVETLQQGKEYEYGFLGIRLDPQRLQPGA